MRRGPEELAPLDRLRVIVKALRFCGQEPTAETVGNQYHYETGEDMDPALYERALR